MNTNLKLGLISLSLLGSFLLTNQFIIKSDDAVIYEKCIRAVELTKKWFKIIENEKEKLGIKNNFPQLKYGALIGDEYTEFTTTLGSIEAKELSTNPNFAGVILEKLVSLDVGPDSKIGLTISGSFPSLAISVLAAAQVIGCKVVLISSVGASMFGANQLDATWLDYERWLREKGEMNYRSSIVTFGGEGDNGEGMLEEGRNAIIASARKNDIEFYQPKNLLESITHKTKILLEENINVFINIGGNQASVGNCLDNTKIPNGLLVKYLSCCHIERGIISRIGERNISTINILNIKNLYAKFGLPTVVTNSSTIESHLFSKKRINYVAYFFVLLGNIGLIVLLSNKKNGTHKN